MRLRSRIALTLPLAAAVLAVGVVSPDAAAAPAVDLTAPASAHHHHGKIKPKVKVKKRPAAPPRKHTAPHHTKSVQKSVQKPSHVASIKVPARGGMTLADVPPVWRRIAMCESGGKVHAHNPSGKYVGLWQLDRRWYTRAGVNPETATVAQQWKIVQYVFHRQGFGAWTCAHIVGLR